MPLFKRFCLVAIVYGLLSGCSKEPTPQLLIGNWIWAGSSGGIAGVSYKPQPSERIVLNFSSDGRFSVLKNDTLSYKGTFELTKARSIYSGKDELQIESKPILTGYQPTIWAIIVTGGIVSTLSATQLSIGDNRYDGFGSSFVRN